MLRADGLSEAIVGICRRCGQEDIVLYDEDKVLEILVERDGMDYNEAKEYYEFNIVGAWLGEGTPAFYFKFSSEEIDELIADDPGIPAKTD